MSGKVITFGKYKGRDIVEVLETDPAYSKWLTEQPWFRDKYITLHQTIINRGAETEETPDHNALQVLFLDSDFCDRFVQAIIPEVDMTCDADVEFEVRGVDVVIRTSILRKEIPSNKRYLFYYFLEDGGGYNVVSNENCDYHERSYSTPLYAELRVELKPSVGDDYPAILRQMKRNGSKILFLRSYTGEGATGGQFIKTFAASGFHVVFLRDVA